MTDDASTAPSGQPRRRRWLRPGLLGELLRFGTVGGVAFVVDMGLFNLLALGGMPLASRPTTAKIISAFVATVVSWVLNRSWTFRSSATSSRWREFLTFALVNGAAIAVGAVVLWLWVYPLGMDGSVGRNVGSVVGIALGTVVRYIGYKLLVFRGEREPQRDVDALTAAVDVVPPPRPTLAAAPDPDRAGSVLR